MSLRKLWIQRLMSIWYAFSSHHVVALLMSLQVLAAPPEDPIMFIHEPDAQVNANIDIQDVPEDLPPDHLHSDLDPGSDDDDSIEGDLPPGEVQAGEAAVPGTDSNLDDIRTAAAFINALKNATLESSNMTEAAIERLRAAPPELPHDLEDPDFLFSLRSFLSVTNASEETYNGFRAAALARHPDDRFFSFDQMKRRVEQISGIIPIIHDMCVNTCAAFTGPFSDLDACPECSELRYHPDPDPRTGDQIPRRQFPTIPVGPVIQALYRSPKTAAMMRHRVEETRRILDHLQNHGGQLDTYDDTYCGQDYLDAVRTGKIKDDDVVLQLSFDSAQLFKDKASDCWTYLFLVHNLPPQFRYLKIFVAPGGFVGGPNKPKNLDSFIYPGLHHISALQKEGLRIWNAATNAHILQSLLFLAFAGADGVAMAEMLGMVGHRGKHGCRVYCGIPGRRRPRDTHYYPVMLKPLDYHITGCAHDDITFQQLNDLRQVTSQRYDTNLTKLVSCTNPTRFEKIRLQTGLTKPTILSGLAEFGTFGIPKIINVDIMHLVTLNDPDLLISLWRGTIQCYLPDRKATWDWAVLKGDVWKAHGKTVALATSFLPSSFERAPRNPAEKINSSYKAWEFLLYIFGLGPALFRSILPVRYWSNYCKLVRGIQLLQQRSITAAQLTEGTVLLAQFAREFEELYYQRQPQRIHFIRHSIHLLTHIGPETVRVGPMSCYAQWTMETLIGNLKREIRQRYDPFANIAQRGILRAQLNSMQSIIPNLELRSKDNLPRGAMDLGAGYALLRACQETETDVPDLEANAILQYWGDHGWRNMGGWTRSLKRWARARLPNGQIARSLWYESRSKKKLRRTRNVKVRHRSIFFNCFSL